MLKENFLLRKDFPLKLKIPLEIEPGQDLRRQDSEQALIYQLVEKSSTMLSSFSETKRVLLSITGENTKNI